MWTAVALFALVIGVNVGLALWTWDREEKHMQTRDTYPQLTIRPKGGKSMPCGSKKGGGKKR